MFFHYLILIHITDSCLVLFRRQKRQQPCTEQPQCEGYRMEQHPLESLLPGCAQSFTHASWDRKLYGCYFVTPPYIPTCRDPKILLSLPKKGSKNNIARRTYFMGSRISMVKERNSNKYLIT